MPHTTILDAETAGIITRTLNVDTIESLIDRDYKDITGVTKEKVAMYNKRIRGSVRLGRLLFYTPDEYAAQRERKLTSKLPH